MQNFTTQEHPRHHSTVVENPGKTIANLREKQRNRNLVNGVIIATMAMAVVVTGSVLGSTVAHNQQLKGQLGDLTTQNQALNQQITELSTDNEITDIDEIPTATYYDYPGTRIVNRATLAPHFTSNNTTPTTTTSTVNQRTADCPDCVTDDADTQPTATTATVNPPVMAEPVVPTAVESNAPTPRQHHRNLLRPADDEPTPMPRVPNARHARWW